jgi:hypothetical protein
VGSNNHIVEGDQHERPRHEGGEGALARSTGSTENIDTIAPLTGAEESR